MDQDWLELAENAQVVRTTEKALLVCTDFDEFWVPRSQIADDCLEEEGDSGPLLVTRWWAEQNREIDTVDDAVANS